MESLFTSDLLVFAEMAPIAQDATKRDDVFFSTIVMYCDSVGIVFDWAMLMSSTWPSQTSLHDFESVATSERPTPFGIWLAFETTSKAFEKRRSPARIPTGMPNF